MAGKSKDAVGKGAVLNNLPLLNRGHSGFSPLSNIF